MPKILETVWRPHRPCRTGLGYQSPSKGWNWRIVLHLCFARSRERSTGILWKNLTRWNPFWTLSIHISLRGIDILVLLGRFGSKIFYLSTFSKRSRTQSYKELHRGPTLAGMVWDISKSRCWVLTQTFRLPNRIVISLARVDRPLQTRENGFEQIKNAGFGISWYGRGMSRSLIEIVFGRMSRFTLCKVG